jgi:Protein of unknown function (DUF3572)
MTPENAEILALEGLGWLAGDGEAIARFLNLSGIDPADLRQAAGEPGTAVAVLDFLLADDALLVAFCEQARISPKQLPAARQALGGAFE